MLDTITLERLRTAIVHVHRERYGDGTLGHHQALAVASGNFQVVGDDAELLARHLKNVVFVDAQGGNHKSVKAPEKGAWKSGICACSGPSSNRIRCFWRLGFQSDLR